MKAGFAIVLFAVACVIPLSPSPPLSSDGGDSGDGGCAVTFPPPDPAKVSTGMALVAQYGCQQCHGSALTGDANGIFVPNSTTMTYPPNLTPDPTTGLGCWSDGAIVTAILRGVDNQGQGLCAPMPHFVQLGLDSDGAAAIVAYLRSLPPQVSHIPDAPDCSCVTDGDCPPGEVCLDRTCTCDGVCRAVAPPDAAMSPDAAMATDAGVSLDAANRD